jgi:amino acid permease
MKSLASSLMSAQGSWGNWNLAAPMAATSFSSQGIIPESMRYTDTPSDHMSAAWV